MKTAQREKLLELLLDGTPIGTVEELDDMLTAEIDRIAPMIDYWIADRAQEQFKAGKLQAYLEVMFVQYQRDERIQAEYLKQMENEDLPF
jgi:hypothetical protein